MDPERWQRIQDLFAAGAELDDAGRAALLDRECAGDLELRRSVERLYASDAVVDGPLTHAIVRAAADAIDAAHTAAGAADASRRYGSWRLIERIATGGMGTVWRAERADGRFEQRVAIKLLNPAMLAPEALARFDAERRILASLSHPNIARLLDGGTADDGTPWLAMEYVEGATIVQHCAERELDARVRVQLFLKVCAAVDHAHRNLVVHRDLKPSNILVDRDGEPKLLDFGIAKLVDPERRDATVTAVELRALTPAYASPEQLLGAPITTATDVYSLGVLLYELLSGIHPYGPTESTPVELHRAILDRVPEPPSAAAAGTRKRDDRTRRRARRHVPIHGDLDTIVLMALRKEPARRYGSVRALADDLERYLRDEPVVARADSLAYRTGKFVKRNRARLAAVTAVVLVVGAFAAFSTARVFEERDTARAAQQRAEATTEFLIALLKGSDPYATMGETVTLRDVLDRAATRVDAQLAGQPEARAQILNTLGDVYWNMYEQQKGVEYLSAALDLRRELFGDTHAATAETMRLLGFAYANRQRVADGIDLLERSVAANSALFGRESVPTAMSLHKLAYARRMAGDNTGALRDIRDSLAIYAAVPEPDAYDWAMAEAELGRQLGFAKEWDASLAAFRRSIAIHERAGQAQSLPVATTLQNIGIVEWMRGRYAEAEQALLGSLARFDATMGTNHWASRSILSGLARVYRDTGRFEEALALHEKCREMVLVNRSATHPDYAVELMNQATTLMFQGRDDLAEADIVRALAIYRGTPDLNPLLRLAAETQYGRLLVKLGRDGRAAALMRKTLDELATRTDAASLGMATEVRGVLGAALLSLAPAEGLPMLEAAYAQLLAKNGPGSTTVRQHREQLLRFHSARGDADAVERLQASVEP